MGLDIYAGTLTRYYAGNWKNAVQQWAEANGYTFNKITPDGEAILEEALDPREVEAVIVGWRDWLLEALAPEGETYAPWPEDNGSPYYTDKPDWVAYGALLLCIACGIYEEPLPQQVPKDWDFSEHPLIVRAMADEEVKWSLLSGATFWLPITGSFWFQCPDPAGNEQTMATLDGLASELAKINEMLWQAEEAEILSWSETEGYPVEKGPGSDGISMTTETEYDAGSLAKFAYSMFYQALQFAQAQKTAIILDY